MVAGIKLAVIVVCCLAANTLATPLLNLFGLRLRLRFQGVGWDDLPGPSGICVVLVGAIFAALNHSLWHDVLGRLFPSGLRLIPPPDFAPARRHTGARDRRIGEASAITGFERRVAGPIVLFALQFAAYASLVPGP